MPFTRFNLSTLLVSIPAILLCLTVHEMAHGYAAYLLGDATAKHDGRLSFNPLRHIDPIGFLCLLVAGFGWAKPVMVDPRNFKKPRRDMAIVAAAGPLSNFLLAFLLTILWLALSLLSNGVLLAAAQFFAVAASMSIGLGVFNLIPIPPLDGSKVLLPVLPSSVINFFYRYERYIQVGMLLLLWFGKFDYPLSIASRFIAVHFIDAAVFILSFFGV